ncbi:hypothetical protein [Stigmatella ashevillensis]|uniref:hypothetical protein n=1 Tax=Stigmatella ashevillensis TaxID=2995309 RepID=UPI00358DCCEE
MERLARMEDGRIAYRMKRPLPDGTTHLLFTGLLAYWEYRGLRRNLNVPNRRIRSADRKCGPSREGSPWPLLPPWWGTTPRTRRNAFTKT